MRLLIVAAILVTAAWCPPARAQDDVESRARGHYEIAQGLYRLGDYRGAIKEFSAGYALLKKPRFLLNIGTMYRKLGDLTRARDYFRQFLDAAAADDPERPQAEDLLKELDDQLRANPQPPVPEPEPTPTPPPVIAPPPPPVVIAPAPRRNRAALRGTGIALGVFGVLSLGGGVASGVLAGATANDLNALDKAGGTFDPAKDSLYGTERVLEGVFLGVGAAATVTGVVLYIVGRR